MNVLPNTIDIIEILSFPKEVKQRIESYLDKPVQNVRLIRLNDMHIIKTKADASENHWTKQSLLNLYHSISQLKTPTKYAMSSNRDVTLEDVKIQGYFDMRNLEDEDIF